ncbi:MAG: DUF6624 domain-containing protein [Zymomonas mobilis]|uniref:Uncharacterized protein n=1 Tax=Zymomonas mobilis TaxID=542 RepID=A0A542W2J1_ZYMMB|nr:DUF6624 domain-containing protein [Zymomonas mobilis]TQL17804.1 hypothetical protein FBY58_1409 [Zymomonas mobilis]
MTMIKKAFKAFTYLSGHRDPAPDITSIRPSGFQKKIIFFFIMASAIPAIGRAESLPASAGEIATEMSSDSCISDHAFPGYALNHQNFKEMQAASHFKKQAKMLIAMSEHEQAVRSHFAKGQPIDWKEVEETDRKNTRDFKKMIDKEGLFALSQVGGDAVAAEFHLIQRSHDIPFQRSALDMMRHMLARQDFPGDYVAILEDQLLARDGKPQIYGTQVKKDGSLYPVIDKDQLDARRASHGLAPLREAICPLSKTE